MHSSEATQPTRARAQPAAPRGCSLSTGFTFILGLLLVLIGILAAWAVLQVLLLPYDGRIYPNVYVLGVDVGGLAPDEAAARLTAEIPGSGADWLLLSDGERAWPLPWAEVGAALDVGATVEAAFHASRANPWRALRTGLLEERCDVNPVLSLEPTVARQALERLSPHVSTPPVEPSFRLERGGLSSVPGRPGRALDVEATLERLVACTGGSDPRLEVPLQFQTVPPRIPDATPFLAEAEAMLPAPMRILTYDVLADETLAWTLGQDVLAYWLQVEGDGEQARVDVARDTARATLERLAAGLTGGRGLRMEEATDQVVEAFRAGGGEVWLYLTHPPRTYTVEPGDRLTTIGVRFGMPPGLIAEANPGVDPDRLSVGQQLTIPSQDVLTPHIPVEGKRIVIRIAEQRMHVYEHERLLYDWPISTGIPESPTYPGIYQILGHEPNAYASQWELWMPHFMPIYRAGADVYNGIHALPTLSDGGRLWEGALGSPASFGCIVLGTSEAQTLYEWAEVGVLVIIQ